jgi:hypothetical protein
MEENQICIIISQSFYNNVPVGSVITGVYNYLCPIPEDKQVSKESRMVFRREIRTIQSEISNNKHILLQQH